MGDLIEPITFQNLNILPAQFFPRRRDNAAMDPLRRLAMAVLLDAVHVFQTTFGATRVRRRREFDEAREWLLGAPGQGPFALENVCFLVDIDPSGLRKWLQQWQAMKRAGATCRILRRRSAIRRFGPLKNRPPRRKLERTRKAI
jgi:hypothetical protein